MPCQAVHATACNPMARYNITLVASSPRRLRARGQEQRPTRLASQTESSGGELGGRGRRRHATPRHASESASAYSSTAQRNEGSVTETSPPGCDLVGAELFKYFPRYGAALGGSIVSQDGDRCVAEWTPPPLFGTAANAQRQTWRAACAESEVRRLIAAAVNVGAVQPTPSSESSSAAQLARYPGVKASLSQTSTREPMREALDINTRQRDAPLQHHPSPHPSPHPTPLQPHPTLPHSNLAQAARRRPRRSAFSQERQTR